MKIEKSAEVRRKEARIEELEEQLKRTRTTLKSLKTRLSNTQQRVEEIHREMFNKASRMQERLTKGLKNLEELTQKLRKDKRLSREDKELIEEIYRGVAGGMGGGMPDWEAQAAERAENQEEEAKFRDAFKEFRVEPPKEEQRDIRKLYLRLSKQFHPDRASNKKEAKQFHQFQQQVNEAYEKHDIQALLDMEQIFGETGDEPENGETATTDVLDHKISRLQNQLALLQQQQERLSEEIRQLRKSDMGQALTEVDSMERAGFSIEEGMGLQQLEPIVEILEAFEKALRDTDKKGKMSPLFEDIMGQMMLAINPLAAMMDEMMGEDEDFDDMFWDDFDDDEFYPNLDPEFPVGTYVRVAEEIKMDYFDVNNGAGSFSLKGLSGIVSAAMFDEEGEPVYNIALDTDSMKRLPRSIIVEEGADFNVLYYLEEDLLVEQKGKKKEPAKKVAQTYRTLLYQNAFSELPPEQDQRLQAILLANPAASDEANWLAYLEQHLHFPFGAFTHGLLSNWRRGRKVTILAYGGFAPEYGLIVQARIGRQTDFVPLAEFYGSPGSKEDQILEDYQEWHGVMF
ncbi:MAG: DnaJ domain-containing protein [Lewinellaceae bacterium]|nr:DnaJ domain-containing protein [Phaeodactylibacter sp.]MCB9035903.1 DnaJ domain-containing protein [Lewinellaceae bacterium]